MRANTHRVDSHDTSIDGFVRLLDHFAALPARAPTHRGRRDNGRPQALRAVPGNSSTATMLARTRVGFAGLTVILLVGALGFALWSGPQSCNGCDDALVVTPSAQASDSAATASRFQYTATAELGEMLKQQPSQLAHDRSAPSKRAEAHNAKLPAQSVSAAAHAEDNIAPSPMATSATGRLYEPQSLTAAQPPQHGGRLPEVAAEVSDAAPKPLKLTAASDITDEIAPTQSVLAVERSLDNEISTIDVPVRKPKASSAKRPQVQSQRRRRAARAQRKVKAAQSSSHVPAWAKKMFDDNWQNKAFSYQ